METITHQGIEDEFVSQENIDDFEKYQKTILRISKLNKIKNKQIELLDNSQWIFQKDLEIMDADDAQTKKNIRDANIFEYINEQHTKVLNN